MDFRRYWLALALVAAFELAQHFAKADMWHVRLLVLAQLSVELRLDDINRREHIHRRIFCGNHLFWHIDNDINFVLVAARIVNLLDLDVSLDTLARMTWQIFVQRTNFLLNILLGCVG